MKWFRSKPKINRAPHTDPDGYTQIGPGTMAAPLLQGPHQPNATIRIEFTNPETGEREIWAPDESYIGVLISGQKHGCAIPDHDGCDHTSADAALIGPPNVTGAGLIGLVCGWCASNPEMTARLVVGILGELQKRGLGNVRQTGPEELRNMFGNPDDGEDWKRGAA